MAWPILKNTLIDKWCEKISFENDIFSDHLATAILTHKASWHLQAYVDIWDDFPLIDRTPMNRIWLSLCDSSVCKTHWTTLAVRAFQCILPAPMLDNDNPIRFIGVASFSEKVLLEYLGNIANIKKWYSCTYILCELFNACQCYIILSVFIFMLPGVFRNFGETLCIKSRSINALQNTGYRHSTMQI